jgi:hypothetical protein
MMKSKLVAGAVACLFLGALASGQQRSEPAPPGGAGEQRGPAAGGPGGPGGSGGPGGPGIALAAYYTNGSTPLGPIDTSPAGRACPAKDYARLVCLAELLKKDLRPELLARVQLPYSAQDGQRWSNFPPMVYRNRVGVTLGEMTPVQLGVVKAILKQAAGIAPNEGYDEIEQILNADDYLKQTTAQSGFASGNFQIAFLGTPSPMGTWQLYFGGHHLAVTSTFKDGALAGATPSFRGVEPFTAFRQNGRDNAPLAQEHAAFAAMLAGLSADEQSKARLSQTFTDIIVGPQRENTYPGVRSGVRAGDLKESQRRLIQRAIETYINDIEPADARAILEKYRRELADTYVAFSGTPALNAENDYVRIDGPSVWIEFSMQPGRIVPGIHPHSVWRDRGADYGGNK